VFEQAFNDASGEYLLPLSGGLDSRGILGGLLENVERSRIQMVTFGVPGAWDFEIASQVARWAGVEITRVDLTRMDWDTGALVQFAGQLEYPIHLFEAYPFSQVFAHLDDDKVFCSGFMGDPLAGSHLPAGESPNWAQARSHFVDSNRAVRSLDLTAKDYVPADCLPELPMADPRLIGFDDQLDFGVRQSCYTQSIVLPTAHRSLMPFLYPEWVALMLKAPRRDRQNEWLYKEILKAAYPGLFALPTKTNRGLPLDAPWRRSQMRRAVLKARSIGRRLVPANFWGTDPRVNYIDFDRGLREDASLRAVVRENLQDLKKRGIVDWIDVTAIWLGHQDKRGDFADALTLLASLEIYLKAQEGTT
jgi:hypothetical protein